MQIQYDVIITGGSYSGLAAAMALGRSLRKVLVIDSQKPCNRFTPHSHNFITHDGAEPARIAALAREQVLAYPTIKIVNSLAISAAHIKGTFTVITEVGTEYTAKKLLFATGMNDILPQITGLDQCWGISAVHCPYCHGYEYRHTATGILGNGDAAYHYALLVNNLTHKLAIYTNGPAVFTESQFEKFAAHNIKVYESPLQQLNHKEGYIESIELHDGTINNVSAIYVRPDSKQHCTFPQELGCNVNEQGYVVTDFMQKTTMPGIFAAGDCCSQMRSVSNSVAQGNMAGAAINAELCTEEF